MDTTGLFAPGKRQSRYPIGTSDPHPLICHQTVVTGYRTQDCNRIDFFLQGKEYVCCGVALLPLRADPDANANTDDTPVSTWQEVGDRMRDIRAMRGKYVRLELR